MINISNRLKQIAECVTTSAVIADVGCDHAFTDIYLLESEKIKKAIAMDVKEGPLKLAEEHVKEYSLSDSIELRLSDGLKALNPGEADGIIISGMGGMLIKRILNDGKEKLAGVKELILSPQSDQSEVRHYLHELGFFIDKEIMLYEAGKYYVIIHAVPDKNGEKLGFEHEYEYVYGKYLIDNKDDYLKSYLESELKRIEQVSEFLKNQDTEGQKLRLKSLEEEKGAIYELQHKFKS
jgi:tRNA (adenine22-N1)-methyltransferase